MAESKRDEKNETDSLVYAAIDFGTTFTGFAFGFRSDVDTGSIFTSLWGGAKVMSDTPKAPTVVLLDENKAFHSFGYEAEDKFQDLKDEEEADKWFYFERFKMKLYDTKKLSRETKIKDHLGNEHKAIDIFSMVIKHIKEKTAEQIKNSLAGFQPEDILWVLTVPAIWSDAARQFMREAATNADIADDKLKLVLEPEAASSFINTKQCCKVAKYDGTITFEELPIGEKYIVADLGGGTADLAVHEVLEDRNLREVSRSDGDAHGGLLVNKAFEKFLVSIFGEDAMSSLDVEFLKLRKDFEITKRKFDMTKKEDKIKFELQKSLLKDSLGDSYDSKVKDIERKHPGIFKFPGSRMFLVLSFDIMKSFFDDAVDGIIKFIDDLRTSQSESVGRISTLVMVGGFSESLYVQQRINKAIQGMRIIVPQEASLAVLKGAVILGRNPKSITERIARFTYGFSNARIFDPASDPESLKIVQDGEVLCSSVFCEVIKKGQILKVGDRFSKKAMHECSSVLDMFWPIVTAVYKSDKENPKYATEEDGSKRVGRIIGFPPSGGWLPVSVIEQTLVVGESEFTVVVKDILKDYIMESKLDFLSEDDLSITGREGACSIM